MQGPRKAVLVRLIVFLLIVMAAMKWFSNSSVKEHVSEPDTFWGKREGDVMSPEEESKVQEEPPKHAEGELEKPQEPWKQEEKPDQQKQDQEKPKLHPVKDFSSTQMRIVHLDLKGAAPKVSYLEQIFPLLFKLGANGVLIEYEDMFPYSGDLEILKSENAYSVEDIEKIQHLAELSQLEVIPLVQVFGHLEFVLKHEKYHTLREVTKFPNSLNPHMPDSLLLVKSLISQVLDRHPKASWIHVGADEVYHLGEGEESKNWLNSNNGDKGKMFLNHMKKVGGFIVSKYPGVSLLMWDDMMRQISVEILEESGITLFASPMIWDYSSQLNIELIETYISNYAKAGFKTVWFASSFKGASGSAQIWTPINQHMNNQLSWLKVIGAMEKHPSICFQGIALTGWQRYDHFSALCELFPVAVPAMAVCLQSLVHGGFNDEARKQTMNILGCNSINLDKSFCEGGGAFAGYEIYQMVHHIKENLKMGIDNILQDGHIRGTFSRYHRKHRFANPRNIEMFGDRVFKLHDDWEKFIQDLYIHMGKIYFPDTVEEWMEENVYFYMDQLKELVKDYKQIIQLNGRPKTS
ncbi:hexosaminidase D-like [Acipenser oxyrinchus oxyrinchus]|uniref:beta-N-acetylhexosaminidase n=1 Tax=Acipenser oxyrinchus oxyrinchus TaxID=40147 RepID=A0AAD8D3I2_ACIOX|nr:hexosaminidase D-like [Acipenser oxyrinchus oxyrinchus]